MGDEKEKKPIEHLVEALKNRREMKRAKAMLRAATFSELLARKPMREAMVGPLGMAWRKSFAAWRARCDANREGTYRNPTRAARKAMATHRYEANRAKRIIGTRAEQRAAAKVA